MRRGDIVIVSMSGDFGKPRPAVVVQTNALPQSYSSVMICPITSTIVDLDFRILIEPSVENGLRLRSQVMTDKVGSVLRSKVGPIIGHVDEETLRRLNGMLVFLLALTETENI